MVRHLRQLEHCQEITNTAMSCVRFVFVRLQVCFNVAVIRGEVILDEFDSQWVQKAGDGPDDVPGDASVMVLWGK